MHVGAALVELHIEGSRSLKEKRGVIRSITQRVRNRFNVSVAEVDGQDTWTWALIGLTTTGHDPVAIRRVLERVVDFVEDLHLAEVRAADVELLRLPHAPSGVGPDDEDD
jgi:uncharacterized protein YlxP (DUF503 family)